MSRIHLYSVLLFCTVLVTSCAGAQQSPPTRNWEMQEGKKLMMPGEGHKPFTRMAGNWTTKMKIWNYATHGAGRPEAFT